MNTTQKRLPTPPTTTVAPALQAPEAKAGTVSVPRASRAALRATDFDNWDQRLGFLMHDVSRLRRNVFDEFMKPVGATRSQWWVLAHLSRHDGMIQSDLANVLELGKAALGGLLDRLENSGLIERRSDEIDRRAKRVYLLPKGNQHVTEMRLKSHEMSERMLQGLDLEARQALADMLMLVKRNLVAIKKEKGLADQ
ncbi:MarR family transcriptional regulator, transcriptional regulator for hemolysin [Paraburkholderia sacchari]|uniref:MarR family winged helix-turn-helix transcriptional regulator n=1 Tax=Paraburkholderia sacchari TaxID=159450 RepID=UPI0039A6F76E